MAFGDFTVDRNSPKWVLDSDGYLKEYANDEPAIEFNADGSYKGVLVEPQSVNLCKQSEDINTTWGPLNATPTAVTDETPDGDTSSKFIKLVDDNTGGGATGAVRINQNITVSGGTKYTASVFLKKDGLNWAVIEASGSGGTPNSPYQYFDLDTGVLGTGTAGIENPTIEEYPNDWYRCSVTWTQGAGDTDFNFRIYVAEVDDSTTVDLDGTSSIFVWGAQVEASPIATSYIPTTTGAVTRVKDDINLTSASSLIGQTEGTLYVEVDWRLATGTNQYLLSANDGSSSNRILIRKTTSDSLNMLLLSNGSVLTDQGESSTGYSGIQKFAFAYKTDDFELYRNGSSISSDTSGSLSSLGTLTDVDFGQSNAASLQANMWIRAVALFTTRLSDAECEALTTL